MRATCFGPSRALPALVIFISLCWQANAAGVGADAFVHKSGVFSVNATSPDVEETEASAHFTHTMAPFGSITGWDEVDFVKPEWSQGITHSEVMERIVSETSNSSYESIKRKKDRPSASILESMATEISGRKAFYAKARYPRYPGTGLTVFNEKGKQQDADFVAYLNLKSIDDLGLLQRDLPVEYLLVVSFRAESMTPEQDKSHLDFLASLRIVSPPGYVTERYAGLYGFDLLIPDARVAYGSLFSTESVATETLYVFADGTALEDLGNEQLFETLGIVRVEAMRRKNETVTIDLEKMREIIVWNLEKSGESFDVADLAIPLPAFKISITEPVHLIQVCIETEQLLFIISAGRDDEILEQIVTGLGTR